VALVDCPECERQVSTLAAFCPHCGFPISGRPPWRPPQAGRGPRAGPTRLLDHPGGLAAVIVMSILILRHADDGSPAQTTAPVTTVGAPPS